MDVQSQILLGWGFWSANKGYKHAKMVHISTSNMGCYISITISSLYFLGTSTALFVCCVS